MQRQLDNIRMGTQASIRIAEFLCSHALQVTTYDHERFQGYHAVMGVLLAQQIEMLRIL